ncbi:CRISPR-associated protein Csx19 [Frisingicoccus sp.]|uniref:type III-D CRISPR-associated protein Csx19 n=1 Tax=Frisingicoccus sp. TaxID=1918627 RepID=UPI003AB208F2
MKTTYIKREISGSIATDGGFGGIEKAVGEKQAGIIYYVTDDCVDFGYYDGHGNWKFYKNEKPDVDELQEMYLIFPDKEIYLFKLAGELCMRTLAEADTPEEDFEEVLYSEEKHYMWGSRTGAVENGFYTVSEDSGITYHLPENIASGDSYVYTMRYYFKVNGDGIPEPAAERIVSVDGGIRK